MNVLLMTDKLVTGGAEMYFCKLENELQHENITLYTAAATGDLVGRIKNKDKFLELSRKNHFANILRLRRFVKEKKIEVLHANSLRLVLYAMVLKCLLRTSIKLIYTKHNVTILEQKLPKLFARVINSYVDKTITVSEFEQNNLVGLGVDGNRVTTIYNGVDVNEFMFSPKEDVQKIWNVGILARLAEEKNHEFFLRVAHRLRNVPHLQFFIGGDGPQFSRIADEIESLGLASQVRMIGHVDRPETFIRDMDLLLLTSKREVFPMVVIEAMAVGTPMISIDKGGINEAIRHSETGFLISDFIVEEFCEKILTVIGDGDLKRRIVYRARKKVEQEFSLQKMVDHTANEYLVKM